MLRDPETNVTTINIDVKHMMPHRTKIMKALYGQSAKKKEEN